MASLHEILNRFDGKTTAGLVEAKQIFSKSETFLAELVDFAADDQDHIAIGATWRIKASLDDGGRLPAWLIEKLIRRLDAVTSWQAQLHICQSARHLAMPDDVAHRFATWLRALLTSDRPFLRSWSMDALQHLASRHSRLRPVAAAALSAAAGDPAASVRARVRRWRATPT
ncbi:MAG: hypothetical protein ACFB6S_11350 [Geminicoccaceae bacterium]